MLLWQVERYILWQWHQDRWIVLDLNKILHDLIFEFYLSQYDLKLLESCHNVTQAQRLDKLRREVGFKNTINQVFFGDIENV